MAVRRGNRLGFRLADGPFFANVHVGGIPRSTDGARTWTPTIEVRSDVHQVIVPPSHPGLVLAATGRGLARGDDNGENWRFEHAGLHGGYLRAVALADDTLYLTALTGSSSRQGAVHRRALDSAAAFERCRTGLPEWFPFNLDTGSLAASDSSVVVGTEDGAVYASSDHGANWERVAHGLASVRAVLVE